ncbi:TPA: hypothetical protein ACH3X2_003762 [Trebouxia sp. C0005]
MHMSADTAVLGLPCPVGHHLAVGSPIACLQILEYSLSSLARSAGLRYANGNAYVAAGTGKDGFRLFPSIRGGACHPKQYEQLVNGVLHAGRQVLQQLIWDLIWTWRLVVAQGHSGAGGKCCRKLVLVLPLCKPTASLISLCQLSAASLGLLLYVSSACLSSARYLCRSFQRRLS